MDRVPVGGEVSPPPRPSLEPTQPPVQWVTVLLPGGKVDGARRLPLPPSSVEVEERV